MPDGLAQRERAEVCSHASCILHILLNATPDGIGILLTPAAAAAAEVLEVMPDGSAQRRRAPSHTESLQGSPSLLEGSVSAATLSPERIMDTPSTSTLALELSAAALAAPQSAPAGDDRDADLLKACDVHAACLANARQSAPASEYC